MTEFKLKKEVVQASPSPIREFKQQIEDIDGLIDLTLGQPDFSAPQEVHQAAIEAIEANKDGYTASRGLPEALQAISDYLKRHYDLDYQAESEILITNGGTGALFNTIFALLNQGDKVLVPSPHYPVYQNHICFAGGQMITVDVSDDDFILTPQRLEEVLEKEGDIKALLLTYPSNPTGVTYKRDELQALAEVLKGKEIIVVSDEIYSELLYDQEHVSIAEFLPEQTIILNGLSKSHAMTGWRSGMIVGPEAMIDQIFKVNQASVNTVNTITQFASVAAYSQACDSHIVSMRDQYHQRRDYLMEELSALGFACTKADGAFYLFVKIPEDYTGDDHDFCLALAKEAKIGVIPGSAFGEAGQGYFRISYAAAMDVLQEFIAQLKVFVD